MNTRTAANAPFQFKLRSLFLVTTLVAVALALTRAYGVELGAGATPGLCLLAWGVAKRRWNRGAAGGLLVLYLGLVYSAPEPSDRNLRGVVVLNTSGHGYSLGDVVWLVSPGACDPDDVMLYDWEKARPGGFGPPFALDRYGDLTSEQKKYVVARVLLRLGHNYVKARELKQTKY